MKIIDKINSNKTCYSIEFFPPKTDDALASLDRSLLNFYSLDYKPMFIDLTWGAGGSTSEKTLELSKKWTKIPGVDVNMHITCTNMSIEKLDTSINQAAEAGLENLVLLRGDPPAINGIEEWKAVNGGFTCALDLVTYVRQKWGDRFCISVAGYPEGHVDQIENISKHDVNDIMLSSSEKRRISVNPDTGDLSVCRDAKYWADIRYLKRKVEAGADLIITQLFFDVDIFLQFVQDCRSEGILCPILPGIMLIQNVAGFKRMTTMCKTKIPDDIWKRINQIDAMPEEEAKEAVLVYGEELAKDMCQKLYEGGVRFFHLYTLNRERVAKRVIKFISER